jgi:hypothetical protein
MSPLSDPVCNRHDGEVRMSLRSLHGDSSRPDQLLGLYECPDCGDERRVPLTAEAG